MQTSTEQNADLFAPIKIGKLQIKNRIIMPAMILNYPINGFNLAPEWYRFYARAARGGTGLPLLLPLL